MPKPPQTGSDSPAVPWPEIVKFIRQLSHDIRNNLNAVELQSAFLAELAQDAEMKSEVQRLRGMVSAIGSSLQRLTAGVAQNAPNVIDYSAKDFVEDVRKKFEQEQGENGSKVNWDVQLKDEKLQIDPQQIERALLELLNNAFHHERNVTSVTAKAYVSNKQWVFELREPKANFELSTSAWGREPLRNLSHGHYGLGLNRVRGVAEAHGGGLSAEYDRASSTLITKFSLPV